MKIELEITDKNFSTKSQFYIFSSVSIFYSHLYMIWIVQQSVPIQALSLNMVLYEIYMDI